MRRPGLAGKVFALVGGFDCAPAGFDGGLLARMVAAAGGTVAPALDDDTDYLVVGNRRAAGKAAAERRAKLLGVKVLDEDAFLALVHARTPRAAPGAAADFPAFITWLHGAMNRGKVQRALAMLKGESFQLYAHLTDDQLIGVVRSQTQADTVYASWLSSALARDGLAATDGKGPRTDHQRVAQAFLEYAGAQTGEVDWRPTQTMPEDYYAL